MAKEKKIPNVDDELTFNEVKEYELEVLTEEQFNELYEFIDKYRFNHLGAFSYSKEDGTPASKFNDQVEEDIKEERRKKIMVLQQKISKELLADKVGNTYEVLIEDITPDGKYFLGRSYMDVPSEDGLIYIKFKEGISINDYYQVLITSSTEYDLFGEIK